MNYHIPDGNAPFGLGTLKETTESAGLQVDEFALDVH